ncbi:hypothetical protein SAY87_014752 [Trapa incisa]|uniref:Uncharacterized protein n=1 Tax=Trapa incisa TaxID=236973 RepID=A0AAN7GKI2_9MYRT|nr:hypothetical protein SAY87_014752 [Trapa incisa]
MEPGLVAVPEEEAGVDFSWRRALGLADEVEDRHRGRSGAMLHASRLHPLDYPQGREIEQYPSGLSIQRKDSESNRAKSRNRHSIGRGRYFGIHRSRVGSHEESDGEDRRLQLRRDPVRAGDREDGQRRHPPLDKTFHERSPADPEVMLRLVKISVAEVKG